MSRRVRAIVRKEFGEYRRNKLIIFTMAILPVVFLLVVARETFTLPAAVPPDLLKKVLGSARLFLQLIPLLVPGTIAAYSVIGEREQGALEPILTTPATDGELLAGKAIAPLVPAVGLSWLLYAGYVAAATAFAPAVVVQEMTGGSQIVAEIVLAPALAGFATIASLLISARANDIRVAQQLSALTSIPMLLAVSVFSFQVVGLGVLGYVGAAAAIVAIDLAGLRLASAAFSRERLLSRIGG